MRFAELRRNVTAILALIKEACSAGNFEMCSTLLKSSSDGEQLRKLRRLTTKLDHQVVSHNGCEHSFLHHLHTAANPEVISTDTNRVKVRVVRTGDELMIARMVSLVPGTEQFLSVPTAHCFFSH